jgi:hypothetical protein
LVKRDGEALRSKGNDFMHHSSPPIRTPQRVPVAILSIYIATAILLAAAAPQLRAQVPFAGSYVQHFNSLGTDSPAPWVNNTTVPGWFAFASGVAGADGVRDGGEVTPAFAADAGANTAGGLHSYGPAGDGERALGSIGSGGSAAGDVTFSLVLQNTSDQTYRTTWIRYAGEQWRQGGNSTPHVLVFDYALFAEAPTAAELRADFTTPYTAPSGTFDFFGPLVGAVPAVVNGNLLASEGGGRLENVGGVLDIDWPPGAFLVLRWWDDNNSGADHGLSIDDLDVSASTDVVARSIADESPGAPTLDGTLAQDEYGPANTYAFDGAGGGFGGTLGYGRMYVNSDAENLYVAFQPGALLNDYAVMYFDTRPGGFDDAGMNDAGDAGRSVVTSLGSGGDDTFPIQADYALLMHADGCTLFGLHADSLVELPTFSSNCGAGPAPLVREVAVPLASIAAAGGEHPVDFFIAYCSAALSNSNETNPPMISINTRPNPGESAGVAYTLFNRFITESACTPPLAPTEIQASADMACADDPGAVTLTCVGGSGDSIAWFAGSCDSAPIGAGTSIVVESPAETTAYFARWESAGCGVSPCASVVLSVIAPPSVDAGPDAAVCAGSSVALTGSGADALGYAWSGGTGGFSDPSSASTTYTPGAGETGPVVLTLTAFANSPCADAHDTVTVTIDPPPTVDAGPDVSTCAGVAAPLAGSGSSAAGYMWSGGTGQFADPSNPITTYTPGEGEAGPVVLTLTAHGLSGCGDAFDTVTIDVAPAPTADAGPDLVACHAQPVLLAGSGESAGFMWSGGAGSFDDPSLPAAIYTPGPDESGPVTLTLATSGNGPCGEVFDTVVVHVAGAADSVFVDDDYAGLPDGTLVNFPHDGLPGSLVVGCNAFATIPAAHAAAPAGGVITVAPGSYTEPVSLTKSMTLRGAQAGAAACDREGAPESVIAAAGGGIDVNAGHVVIDGFTIRDAVSGFAAGIRIDPTASGFDIRDCIITANAVGILADSDGSFPSSIRSCSFVANNADAPISGRAITSRTGVHALTVQESCFTGHAAAAIELRGPAGTHSDITITDSQFHAEAPLFLAGVTNAFVMENQFTLAADACISLEGGDANVLVVGNTSASGAGGFVSAFTAGDPAALNTDIEIRGNTAIRDAAQLAAAGALVQLRDAAGSSLVALNSFTLSGAPVLDHLQAIDIDGAATGSVRVNANSLDAVGLVGAADAVGVRLGSELGAGTNITIDENTIRGFIAGVHTQAGQVAVINNRGGITANSIGILASGESARVQVENSMLAGNTAAAIRVEGGAIVDAGDCTGANVTGIGAGAGQNGSTAGLNDLTGYGFDDAPPWAIETLNSAGEPAVAATSNSFGAGDAAMLIRDARDDALLSPVVASNADGPTLVQGPGDIAVCAGTLAEFSVAAWNAASYQWRRDAAPIPDATEPTFTISSASESDAGAYDCVVTDACGLQTASLPATLVVRSLPVAPTDAAVDRNDLCADDDASITLTALGGGGNTVEWFAQDCGSAPIGAGTSLEIASPSVTTTYFARWVNSCGASACVGVEVNVQSPPAAPESAVADRPLVCPGDSGGILLSASGGSGTTLRWFAGSCDGAPIGEGESLVVPAPASTQTYFARWENTCAVSACVTVTVTVADTVAPVPDVADLPPITGECSAAAGAPPTATDACAGSIVGTTSDPLVYDAQGTFVITWSYDDGHGNTTTQPQTVIVADATPPTIVCRDASVTLDENGAATIAAAELVETATDNCGTVNILSAEPDTFTCDDIGPNSILVTVDDGHGNISTCTATVNVLGGVVITRQPVSLSVCERQSVTFSVETDGAGAAYQWRFRSTPIPDATAPTYTIRRAGPGDAGGYDVIVSNSCGSATSDPATLTIDHCPTIFVNLAAVGANDGTSWTDAFTHLEDALAAATAGDQIWVAQGTYTPDSGSGDRSRSFRLRSGAALLGGFVGDETAPDERDPAAHRTVLSGDISLPGNADNSYHVVDASGASETTVFDGFTIIAGNADGADANTDKGAGMLCIKGNPSVVSCVFRDNTAVRGGAAFLEDALPVFVGCSFVANVAADGGGAIRAVTSAALFRDSRFHGNSTLTTGGALLNTGGSDTRIVQCVFSGNTAAGGAAVANVLGSYLTINHCTIAGNSAGTVAGGILSTQASSRVAIANTVLFANADPTGETESAQLSVVTGALAVNYSCIEGLSGGLGGIGNIDADPRLVDLDGADGSIGTLDDNARPRAFSALIDGGSNPLGEVEDFDLDGNPRFADDPGIADTGEGSAPVIDIGAYEFAGHSCPCDINRSGDLNSQDFFDFLAGFFDAAPAADFNGDAAINSQDLFDFLACFFAACG